MAKHRVLIMGAGKIGVAVSSLLNFSKDYTVYIGDIKKPKEINDSEITFVQMSIDNKEQIKTFIKEHSIEAIISCLPFNLTIKVATIASECNINYFDPTEDVKTTEEVYQLSKNSKATFVPQCGLAPGFISIAANSLMREFEDIDHVKMRVGALSQSTNNGLNYAFTWSIDGVINEYIHPCIVIENGNKKLVPALSGLETLVIDGNQYEAFNTSGGIGSLADSYFGKVKNIDYKTIRYLGHCDKMKFILQDLRLKDDPNLAKQILMKVVPHVQKDKVVVYVSVQGDIHGALHEKHYTNTLLPAEINNNYFTAIQLTTATGMCTMVDKVLHEKKFHGLVHQEQLSLDEFLNNRFGKYYKTGTIDIN